MIVKVVLLYNYFSDISIEYLFGIESFLSFL